MKRRFLSLWVAAVIAAGIGGCGGGGGSADPLGTDGLTFGHKNDSAGTDWSMAMQVNLKGTVVLTAKIKNASGKEVVGREVTFGFKANQSGATLSASKVNTDAAGEAVVVYTAGVVSGFDVVNASISNGAQMDTNITVGSNATGGRTISMTGSPTSTAAGQSSILTATVTDGSGSVVSGQTVAFSFVSNLSGGPALAVLNQGLTDASGRAVAVYTAGATNPYTEAQDTVKAEIVGTAAAALILTRTPASAAPSTRIVALSASTPSLPAGQSSILTATVTDTAGNPVSGQAVTFQFLGGVAAPSGATLTVLGGGTTDASGQIKAVYTAGATSPTATVQDTVQAGTAGSMGVVIITRMASTAVPPVGYRTALTADVTSLSAGRSTVVTATVTDGSGNPASGQAVTFALLGNNSGAVLTTLGGTTDVTGRVVAVYTAGANSPTATVQDTVQAGTAGSTGAVIITRTPSTTIAPVGYRMALTADVTSLSAGRSTVVTATVTDGSGNPAGGQAVTFALLGNNSGAVLTTLGGTTDATGRAVAVYTAGATTPTAIVQDTIQASTVGSTGAVVMTRTAAGGGVGTGVRMTVTATPTSLIAGAMSVIVAQVNNADGTAAAGLVVTFGFVTNNSGAPALTVVNATTDASGTAVAAYTAGSNSPGLSIQDAVSASVTGSAGAVIITRLAAAGTGNRISVTLTPATDGVTSRLATTTSNCIVQARVLRDDGVTPVANETVTFSIVTGGGAITRSDGTAAVPLTVTTNNSGIASAVFKAPGTATGNEAVVRGQIPGTTNGGDAVGIIYW